MNKEDFKKNVDEFYLENLDKILDAQNPSKFSIDSILEADDKDAEEEKLKADEDKEDDDSSEFEKVDDIMKEIDLSKVNNDGRMELIEIVIDSAQNSDDEDDDFNEFIEKLMEMIEEYQTDEKPEAKEEEEEEVETEEEEEEEAEGEE